MEQKCVIEDDGEQYSTALFEFNAKFDLMCNNAHNNRAMHDFRKHPSCLIQYVAVLHFKKLYHLVFRRNF